MRSNLYLLFFAFSFFGCQKKGISEITKETALWERAEEVVYKSTKELKAQHAAEKNKNQVYSNKIIFGNERYPLIALTFDEGPHPAYTPRILQLLNRYQAKGTFFIVGKMAEKYPELVKSIQNQGHLIANHTYHHVNLTKIPINEITTEWQAGNDVIKNITGQTPLFCRPPGGDYDQHVIEAAKNINLIVALWTINPEDYKKTGENEIKDIILNKSKNGSIILLHDGAEETIHVLPTIIEKLKEKKYQLVDLSTIVSKNKNSYSKL